MRLTERDQSLVIFKNRCVGCIVQTAPYDRIYLISRIVAVGVECAVIVDLASQHLLARLHERNTFCGHIDCRCKIVHLDKIFHACITSGVLQTVKKRIVIMAGCIVDRLGRTFAPGVISDEALLNRILFSCCSGDKARSLLVKYISL